MSQNCFNCKHFYITFDKNAPKGCRKFQIKTMQMPNQIVKAASGHDCEGFENKPNKKPSSTDKPYE
jgi:hypothetical protein